MSLPEVFIATLENAFNQYLSLDPEALPRFESMEGKVIAVEILGLNENFEGRKLVSELPSAKHLLTKDELGQRKEIEVIFSNYASLSG